MRKLLGLLFIASVIYPLQPIQAQQNDPISGLSQRPVVKAHEIQEIPLIDGNVLEDEIWQNVPAFDELIQLRPNAGEKSSERTEIRIALTATTFYMAVVCHDANPEKLVVTDARRDASLDNTDAVLFILDTYHDGQNGFVFGTNSVGVQYDAQVDNEGQGNFNQNRQQGGMIGGFNLNWDASWKVETEVGSYGWSAEFEIPLRTLRFKSGENQTWGFNFRRNIRKTNEIVYWAPLPIQFTLNRLSLAGDLTGLKLKKPGNLKLIPYVLGQASSNHEVDPTENSLRGDAGVDLKYSITPAITLDLTYNTDFAQVEVDDQQVNLDRFNLFFPEKRPFFLENAGLFSVGSPGEVDLFFSRRIGIGEGGKVVPIIGGGRVSGKVNQTNIGFLSMFTEGIDGEVDPNNFTVARVNHQFKGTRSALGGAFISRTATNGEADNYNRVFAADGRWGIGKKAQVFGFFAKSETPGIESGDHSFHLKSAYEWDGLILQGAYTEVGEGFNPEVGFLQRTAFRKPEFLVLQRIRPKNMGGILELRPHISYRGYWDFEGFNVTSFLHIDNHWEWKNGIELHTGINFTREGVVQDFDIVDDVTVPAGTYDHKEAQIVFFTNPSKAVSISMRSVMGGFFGGNRLANSGTLSLRFGDKFNSSFTLLRNDISFPTGPQTNPENIKFNTNVFIGRVAYAFKPNIFTQSLIQYNNVIDLWSANIRFGWLQKANTGLFLVYNENRGSGALSNRSFTIKYSYVFDILK
ncbi:MAG: DUF5916 domain-containing protein [Bacteroidia bacterium]|nr:DUF5916 domain-containing protein [Bacteroidia bacterium]